MDERNAAALREHQRKVYLDFLRERAGVEPPEPEPAAPSRAAPSKPRPPAPVPAAHQCELTPTMLKAIGRALGMERRAMRDEFDARLAELKASHDAEIASLRRRLAVLEVAELAAHDGGEEARERAN